MDQGIIKCLFNSFVVVMFNLLDADLAAGVKFSSFIFHLCIVDLIVNTHVDKCFIIENNVNNMLLLPFLWTECFNLPNGW